MGDFFRRSEPGLRELIAYMVDRALGRGTALTQTKVVKLLYLIDVERHAYGRQALTGLPWIFFHYGPYAIPLAQELERMEGSEITVRRLTGDRAERDVALYIGASGAPDGDDWPATTKALVDRVTDQWAHVELNALLDYVYFETAPMQGAIRGGSLDLNKARGSRRQLHRPLETPPRPDDADNRIARWLARRRAGQTSEPLEPAPRYDADYWRLMRATSGYPESDPGEVEARGGLEVPEDVDL